MGEIILIIVALVLGGLAYWLFGDPDRSERLFARIGPISPLAWILVSGAGAFRDVRGKNFIGAGVYLVCGVIWAGFYLKERRQRRLPQKQSTAT